MNETLIIIGASARAAAQSARKAGYQVVAADLFADQDLARNSDAFRITQYPSEFETLWADMPHVPWMYTGGLENHPQLIERLARQRELWGNDASVVRRVRNFRRLAESLREESLWYPETRCRLTEADSGPWLRKPSRSCGGISITDARAPAAARAGFVYQRRLEGDSLGAVFVADGHAARLLGVTRQLGQPAWTRAVTFGYAGSIGPIALPRDVRDRVAAIGDCLARRFGLNGLFGVDIVLVGDEPWIVEVNPRYVASIELLECSAPLLAVQAHADACRLGQLPLDESDPPAGCAGKAILYADRSVVTTGALDTFSQSLHPESDCWLADIPRPGTVIEEGRPITTVLARGSDASDVLQRLEELAGRVYHALQEA